MNTNGVESLPAELNRIVFALELIGVIAFAVTGALRAIERDMDVFGILVLGLITALGGGIIRDILVNRFPVSLLSPIYFYMATLGSLLAIIGLRATRKYAYWIKLFDALGLAVFSVLGARVGILGELNVLSVLILGLLTGIGGGIIRDVLANEVPLVLRQEVYALASLIGIAVLWLLRSAGIASPTALIISASVIFIIRLAAIQWNLQLPRIRHTEHS